MPQRNGASTQKYFCRALRVSFVNFVRDANDGAKAQSLCSTSCARFSVVHFITPIHYAGHPNTKCCGRLADLRNHQRPTLARLDWFGRSSLTLVLVRQ